MINIGNWNYTQLIQNNKKAFIAIGANPALNEEEDIEIQYLVTVSDLDGKDVFQKSFNDLTFACSDINERYSHWEYQDSRYVKNSGSGCGSCEAH